MLFASSPLYSALRQAGRSHALGGAFARQYWGVPERVEELEVFLWAPFGEETAVASELAAAGFPGHQGSFLRYRQSLFQVGDLRVRLILCALPFEDSMLARSQSDPTTELLVISAEDLLLLTLFRFRPEALDQAKALLLAQRGRLQWPYIDHWLPQLAELKEDPRPLDALNALREALAKM